MKIEESGRRTFLYLIDKKILMPHHEINSNPKVQQHNPGFIHILKKGLLQNSNSPFN